MFRDIGCYNEKNWLLIIYNIIIFIVINKRINCDMARYFMSRLIYFHKPEVSDNKA